jgi:hypothetical protein
VRGRTGLISPDLRLRGFPGTFRAKLVINDQGMQRNIAVRGAQRM